jgi:hypothetical protein
MPLWHCGRCHHEWEGSKEQFQCDWCKADGYVLDTMTELEKLIKRLDKITNRVVQSERKDKDK